MTIPHFTSDGAEAHRYYLPNTGWSNRIIVLTSEAWFWSTTPDHPDSLTTPFTEQLLSTQSNNKNDDKVSSVSTTSKSEPA